MKILFFIPARGGSKSLRLKNLSKIGNMTLIEHIARKLEGFDRVDCVCSTDNEDIEAEARRLGLSVDKRKEELSRDESNVADVVIDYLDRSTSAYEAVVLLQPTSPFVTRDNIDAVVKRLGSDKSLASVQTIREVPHCCHGLNQRTVNDEGMVIFTHKEERVKAYNKQLKKKQYIFGNVVIVRVSELTAGRGFFAEPSFGIESGWISCIDVDGQEELVLANALWNGGLVR